MPNVPNLPGVPALSSYGADSGALLAADVATVVSAFLPRPWGIYYQGQPVIVPATVASLTLGSLNSVVPALSVAVSLLGLPNLLPVVASTVEFDFDQEWTIADYPQEQGAFQSYDKVQLPFECRVRLACGGSASQRQTFLNTIFAIAGGSPLGSSSLISSALSAAGGASALTSIAGSLNGGILSGSMAPPLFDLVTPEGTYSSCSVRRVSFSRKSYEGATLIVVELSFIQVRVSSTATFANTQTPAIAGQQSGGNQQPLTPNVTFPSGSLM